MRSQTGRAAQAGRFLTLLVTNCIKLGGVYLVLRAVVTEAQPSVVQMTVACFMMTGAQVSEDVVLRLVGRMFGAHEQHHEPPT